MAHSKQRRSFSLRLAIAFVLVISAAMLTIMGSVVNNKLTFLTSTSSNSIQWSLTQVETDFYRLINAIHEIDHVSDNEVGDLSPRERSVLLNNVRTKFDQLNVRVATLSRNADFEPIRELSRIDQLVARFETVETVFERDDTRLEANLDVLLYQILDIQPDLRRTVVLGTRALVADTEERQSDISNSLTVFGRLLAVAMALSALAVFAAFRGAVVAEQSQETLERTSSRLSAVVNSSLDAVMVSDTEGRFMEFNPAAEEILGYSREEVIGEFMADLIVPPEMREAHTSGMARYLKTGKPVFVNKGRIEITAQRKDGSIIPVEMSVQREDNAEGSVFIAFLRDISDRKKAEADLLTARDEALSSEEAKSAFLAVMSHEMRTPLNGLIGTMELMKLSEQTPENQEFLRVMEISGKQLLTHVNDVLDISRLDAQGVTFEKEPFNLANVIKDIVLSLQAAADAKGNVFNMDQVPKWLWAEGDAGRINQILLNIIGNAAKFTTDGTITVASRRIDPDTVEIKVSDTGIGIAEADIDTLFDDFVTVDASYMRQSEGTGLGLGIVRRVVDALEGEIKVDSVKGEGTCFTLTLPLPKAEATQQFKERLIEPDDFDVAPRRVLIVEDNEINRIVLRQMLLKLGHTVDEVFDGSQGVNAARDVRYDVIFMDVSMPVMDGVTATRMIRSGHGKSLGAHIVGTTANALESDKIRFDEAGMNDYIFKPISLARVVDLFHTLEVDGTFDDDE